MLLLEKVATRFSGSGMLTKSSNMSSSWTENGSCVGVQKRIGWLRINGYRCFGMRRWWGRILDGEVEIVVDVDCQETKVEAGMAKQKPGVRARAETEFQDDERRTFGHRSNLE